MKFNQRKPRFPPATAVRVFAVVALAGAVMAGPAHAQQAEMTLPTIAGYGGVPGGCGQWIAAPENSTLDLSALSWVYGFLSGTNSAVHGIRGAPTHDKADFLADSDGTSLNLWAKKWCRDHPRDTVAQAAAALFGELAGRSLHGNRRQ
jgi:hypothetical protein